MSRKYNCDSFTPEEVKKGFHLNLLNTLLKYNMESEDYYNDIHITTDGYCLIIEWDKIPYSHEYGGSFKYVDESEVVMLEKIFPDNHIELCYNEEDYQERLAEFLKENPGWVKTEYGTWRNEVETKKIKQILLEENI